MSRLPDIIKRNASLRNLAKHRTQKYLNLVTGSSSVSVALEAAYLQALEDVKDSISHPEEIKEAITS